jgi:F-type H+-transporting ATPase subunit delta
MTQTVGKVYAEALFLLAQEEKKEKQVYEELNAVSDVMAQYPELVSLLSVPTLSTEERLEVLYKVIGRTPGITENFLALLVEKHRISRIAEIRSAFNKQYYEQFSIAEVFVTTAVPLGADQREALVQKMEKKLHKSIVLRETVDETLLGGMIVQYGDTRMDSSLRTRMKQLSKSMEQH